jgi:hypothetical protein
MSCEEGVPAGVSGHSSKVRQVVAHLGHTGQELSLAFAMGCEEAGKPAADKPGSPGNEVPDLSRPCDRNYGASFHTVPTVHLPPTEAVP